MNFVRTFEELTGKYKKETVIIYKDKNLVCMLPKSQMTSNIYGQNTNWCQVSKSGFDDWSKGRGSALLIRFLFKNGRKIRFTYFIDDTFHWASENGFHVLSGSGNPFEAKTKKEILRNMEKDIIDLIETIPSECKESVLKFIEKNKKDFKYTYRKKEYLSPKKSKAMDTFLRCKKKYALTFSNIATDSRYNVYIGISARNFYSDLHKDFKNSKESLVIAYRSPLRNNNETITEEFGVEQYEEFEKRLSELIKILRGDVKTFLSYL